MIPNTVPHAARKGFGFVEMDSEAETAITGPNGETLKERTIMVNETRPRTDNRSGGPYGDRRGEVVATVEVEVADSEEEGRGDIKLPLFHSFL